jgi:hypothetical protein
VSSDIGGTDPDDFQSMVQLLLYSDVLDMVHPNWWIAAEMLDTFVLGKAERSTADLSPPSSESSAPRLSSGTDSQVDAAVVFQQVRFNFMSEARVWYWRNGFSKPYRRLWFSARSSSGRSRRARFRPTCKGRWALGLSGGAGSVQLALVPLPYCKTGRPSAAVWTVCTNGAVTHGGIRSGTQVSGAAGTIAAVGEAHVA